MRTLTVKAKNPQVPVPKLGPRRLNDQGVDVNVIVAEPQVVPDVRYYRRRIEAGDLVLVQEG